MGCVIALHRPVGVLVGGDAVDIAFASLWQFIFRPEATTKTRLELSRTDVLAMYND